MLGIQGAAGAGGDLAQRAAEHVLDGRVEHETGEHVVRAGVLSADLARQALANELGQLLGVARRGSELDQALEHRAQVSNRDVFSKQITQDLQHVGG